MPAVAVVVLNYNGLDDTLKCMSSLAAVEYDSLSVILVDNGSAVDPSPATRRLFPNVEIIRAGINLGYAGGNNRGIERALDRGAEYVLILNNDTIVAPGIVRALLHAFVADGSFGIVGPVINFMDEPDKVMTDGVRFNPGPGVEFFHRLEVLLQPDSADATPVDVVNGCCMMVRSDVFRAVGLFDERLFIVHEESDLCLRSQRAGFRCGVLGQTLVWHKGSSSFQRSGRQLQRYYDTRNLFFLLKRHGGKLPGTRSFGRSLVPFLRYAFYRYSLEMEAGSPVAARAVADGLADALTGKTGPYTSSHGTGAVVGAALKLARAVSRVA